MSGNEHRRGELSEGSQADFVDVLKWLFTRDRGPWDPVLSEAAYGEPPPSRVPPGRGRVTFVNHSTVLIQLDGVNILTDPIYAERASPLSWAGPRRVRPPGIRFEDLPRIDVVLLSHNHYDHMCLETLGRLRDRFGPVIYTGAGNGKLLEAAEVVELDWWQSVDVADSVAVTFVPARHFSGRGLFDRNEALWGGFYVRGASISVLFAGDTAAGPHFEGIRERLGAPDLALIPIGAYRPREIMAPVHLSPAEAVEAHLQLGARHGMAIHYGTFPMADDGQREPVEALDGALARAGLTRDDFWVLDFGEGRELSEAPP